MPLLQLISSIGVKAAGCMDGMGWKSWGRGGEGIWEGKAVGEGIWKAKPLGSGLCFERLDVPHSGLERGNKGETEGWLPVCCR